MFAASALAANTIVRSAVAAAFPLFTTQVRPRCVPSSPSSLFPPPSPSSSCSLRLPQSSLPPTDADRHLDARSGSLPSASTGRAPSSASSLSPSRRRRSSSTSTAGSSGRRAASRRASTSLCATGSSARRRSAGRARARTAARRRASGFELERLFGSWASARSYSTLSCNDAMYCASWPSARGEREGSSASERKAREQLSLQLELLGPLAPPASRDRRARIQTQSCGHIERARRRSLLELEKGPDRLALRSRQRSPSRPTRALAGLPSHC
mgnify:CR=1 FL=1